MDLENDTTRVTSIVTVEVTSLSPTIAKLCYRMRKDI